MNLLRLYLLFEIQENPGEAPLASSSQVVSYEHLLGYAGLPPNGSLEEATKVFWDRKILVVPALPIPIP